MDNSVQGSRSASVMKQDRPSLLPRLGRPPGLGDLLNPSHPADPRAGGKGHGRLREISTAQACESHTCVPSTTHWTELGNPATPRSGLRLGRKGERGSDDPPPSF